MLINLVTPKARAKHEPFVQQTGLLFRGFLSGVCQFCSLKIDQSMFENAQFKGF